MLWAWIDAHAALSGLCLVLAAMGGLFLHLRRPGAIAGGPRMPVAAWRVLGLAGLASALALASMVRDMLCLHAGCAGHRDWPAMDVALQQWLSGHATDAWVRPVALLTQLGHVGWMAGLSLLVLLALLWRRDGLRAGAWLVAAAGVGLSVRGLKAAVGRQRPADGLVSEAGFSFPSGHAAGTLVLYLMLAWLLLPYLRRAWRWPAGLAALAVALGVGASRVLLRVHHPSDVLAGWLLGLAWVALVVCAVEWAWRHIAGRHPAGRHPAGRHPGRH